MEKQILAQVQKAMDSAITSELVGYNKPLSKLTERVIEAHSDELFTLVDGEFSSLIGGDGFDDLYGNEAETPYSILANITLTY